MNQTSQFFEGAIARDYREVLESWPAFEAATKEKAGTTGKNCSRPAVCPKPGTTGKNCSRPAVCPMPGTTGKNCSRPAVVCPKPGTTGKNCSRPKICAKAMAIDSFQPPVAGWSLPPAP